MFKLLLLLMIAYGIYLWLHRSKIQSHLPFVISISLIVAMLLFKVHFPILAFGIFLLFLGEYFIFKTPKKEPSPNQPPPSPGANSYSLTEHQAQAILNLGPFPTKEQINAAYYSQMKKHHPDIGGSKEYASKINAARELLLRLNNV